MNTKDYYTGSTSINIQPFTFEDNECFRISDKNNNSAERMTVSNYWREQINLYGQRVQYFTHNYNVLSADNLYGEDPIQRYSTPRLITVAINLQENALMLS